jgi:hypothetical protein
MAISFHRNTIIDGFLQFGQCRQDKTRPKGIIIRADTMFGNQYRHAGCRMGIADRAAMIEIKDRRIASVAFTPTFADEQSRPSFLTSEHPMFGEIADDIDAISKAAGFSTTFARAADRVIIG